MNFSELADCNQIFRNISFPSLSPLKNYFSWNERVQNFSSLWFPTINSVITFSTQWYDCVNMFCIPVPLIILIGSVIHLNSIHEFKYYRKPVLCLSFVSLAQSNLFCIIFAGSHSAWSFYAPETRSTGGIKIKSFKLRN